MPPIRPSARPPAAPCPSPERGVGTLAVVMVMVMVTSLAALFLNRGVIFEQRAAANQLQGLLAQEAAAAGIEWAQGMLNTPWDIGSNCALLATAKEGFRKRYVLTAWNDATSPSLDVKPATTTYPGCKMTAAGLQCSCPTPPAAGSATVVNPSLGTLTAPSFTIAFDAIADDPEAVRVTAWGCNAQAAACLPGSGATSDGHVRITAVLKLRPLLRAMPASPLTCGTTCTVGGSYNIANQDVATNGILVNAGAGISTASGTTTTTLPGQPAVNALVGNDPSLSALSSSDPTCSNSQMFNAYFGSTMEQFRAAPTTKVLSCTSASDCNDKVNTAYDAGWRSFYMDSDLHLSGNRTYGSVTDPVTLVTPHAVDFNGNNVFWGLIFSNSASWNDLGTGSAHIHGAQISCAAYKNNGNGTLTYDADVLRGARRLTGLLVPVSGSWRDFKVTEDTRP